MSENPAQKELSYGKVHRNRRLPLTTDLMPTIHTFLFSTFARVATKAFIIIAKVPFLFFSIRAAKARRTNAKGKNEAAR